MRNYLQYYLYIYRNKLGGQLKNSLFNLDDKPSPDILVIGLQEMVNLNPQNLIIMSNESNIANWDILIAQNIKAYSAYTQVASNDLVGIYITVLVRKSELHRVHSISTDVLKTGLGGTLGNKGGVGVRFNIN